MVMEDATLTGATVCMGEDTSPVVRSGFVARGTKTEPIVSTPNVDATNNYWGTTDTALIDDLIYDSTRARTERP